MYDDQCDNKTVLFVMVIGPGEWNTMSTIQREIFREKFEKISRLEKYFETSFEQKSQR